VKKPAEPEHDSVEVPRVVAIFNVTLVELRPQVRPDDGETASERATVPTNPLSAVTVIVDVEPLPIEVTEVGFALKPKSSTWNVAVAE
jgi:hypothetical protein